MTHSETPCRSTLPVLLIVDADPTAVPGRKPAAAPAPDASGREDRRSRPEPGALAAASSAGRALAGFEAAGDLHGIGATLVALTVNGALHTPHEQLAPVLDRARGPPLTPYNRARLLAGVALRYIWQGFWEEPGPSSTPPWISPRRRERGCGPAGTPYQTLGLRAELVF